tara:strand:+ start:427 stop:924 length:498 start_codon:yes stop_codon:yes gene_type:complete
MKQLIIIRHCKSSWLDSSLSDYERPLNKRGRNDGYKMSNELSKKIKHVDLLISSSSIRTKLTSNIFIDKININEIQYRDDFYHSSSENIISILEKINNSFKSVIIIGHNPGFTDLVNKLTNINLFNLPTTGIVIVDLNIKNWDQILTKNTGYEINWIKFPKELKL